MSFDKLYSKLSSVENLNLAWMRIKTAQNIQYKNYYRNLFFAYELNKDKNIQILSERLRGGAYKSTEITRFYIPKHSGLHRPISFLYLDDLIVYQAISNIIAEKFHKKRVVVENKNVFSNIYTKNINNDIFFFQKWQDNYKNYLKKIKYYYKNKNQWVASFDLSSYYDTISHQTLLKQISRNAYPDFKKLLADCLNQWSSTKKEKLGHGIPQGPNASNLIGEIYLLPIDIALSKSRIKYVRYVDDIKIFGKTREEVLNGIILLEQECKERGLIPQAKKYEIFEAKNVQDAIGKSPSLSSYDKVGMSKSKKKTYELFYDSFNSPNKDISKVRYILKTSSPNKKILDLVLNNLLAHPDLAQEFCQFLDNYRNDIKIAQQIYQKALLKPSHYEFVEGKYWNLIANFNLDSVLQKEYCSKAKQRLRKTKKNKIALKLGLYKFLLKQQDSSVLKLLQKEQSSFVQMNIATLIAYANYETPEFKRLLNKYLRYNTYEPALIIISNLYFLGKEKLLQGCLKPQKDFPGVITGLFGFSPKTNVIGEILSDKYQIPYFVKWKKLFSTDFKHANQLIFYANAAYYIDRNTWASYTDSFNDILIRKFIDLLVRKLPLTNWPLTKDGNGEVIVLGSILNNPILSRHFPNLVPGIKLLHKRRNKTPTSHAFDKKTGDKTTIITNNEQKELVKNLQISYSELINEVNKLLK